MPRGREGGGEEGRRRRKGRGGGGKGGRKRRREEVKVPAAYECSRGITLMHISSSPFICETLPLIVHSSSRNQSPSRDVRSLSLSRAAEGKEEKEGEREGGRKGGREEGGGREGGRDETGGEEGEYQRTITI